MISRPWLTATGAGVWFLLTSGTCASQELTYPPLPAGVVMTGSSFLGRADTSDVALAEVTQEGQPTVWLARRISGSGKENNRWRVSTACPSGPWGPTIISFSWSALLARTPSRTRRFSRSWTSGPVIRRACCRPNGHGAPMLQRGGFARWRPDRFGASTISQRARTERSWQGSGIAPPARRLQATRMRETSPALELVDRVLSAAGTVAIQIDSTAIRTDTGAIRIRTLAIRVERTAIGPTHARSGSKHLAYGLIGPRSEPTQARSAQNTRDRSDWTGRRSEDRHAGAIRVKTLPIQSDRTAIRTDTGAIRVKTLAIRIDRTAIRTDTGAIRSEHLRSGSIGPRSEPTQARSDQNTRDSKR